MCKMDLSFWYSNCCESTKKLKDPFVKVEPICLFVPIVDNVQYKKYSYLICLLYWCYGAIQVLRNAIFLEIGPPPTPS